MFRIYHWKMIHLKLFEYEIKCKRIPKGVTVQLPANKWLKYYGFIAGKCLHHNVLAQQSIPKGVVVQLALYNRLKC